MPYVIEWDLTSAIDDGAAGLTAGRL